MTHNVLPPMGVNVLGSPAAEVGNLASSDKVFFSLLIISLWDICNNIQVGVEFLPLGN